MEDIGSGLGVDIPRRFSIALDIEGLERGFKCCRLIWVLSLKSRADFMSLAQARCCPTSILAKLLLFVD